MSNMVWTLQYSFILFVCSDYRPVESALKFSKEPSNPSFFTKGGSALLDWDYVVDNRERDLQEITWSVYNKSGNTYLVLYKEYKNGTRVPDNPNKLPPAFKGRVNIKGNAALVIENLTLEDSAQFRCLLIADLGAVIPSEPSTVQLIVTGPAKITPQVIAVQEDDSASFTCNATGIPGGNITWMRKGKTVSDSRYEVVSVGDGFSQLTIKNAVKEDYGYFECGATKPPAKVDAAFFGVSFLSTKNPELVKDARFAAIGELVVLECPVSGFPPPEVTWTLPNGSVLPSRLDTTLSVNLTTVDFGNYTCSAKSLDKALGPFAISMKKRVSSLNFNVASGAPVVVTWDPVSNVSIYAVGITGNEVEDFVQIGGCSLDAEDRCSMEIHFNTLPPKTKPDPVDIFVEVSALNGHFEIVARGDDRKPAKIRSAAVTLQVSFMHLFVVLVLVLNR